MWVGIQKGKAQVAVGSRWGRSKCSERNRTRIRWEKVFESVNLPATLLLSVSAYVLLALDLLSFLRVLQFSVLQLAKATTQRTGERREAQRRKSISEPRQAEQKQSRQKRSDRRCNPKASNSPAYASRMEKLKTSNREF